MCFSTILTAYWSGSSIRVGHPTYIPLSNSTEIVANKYRQIFSSQWTSANARAKPMQGHGMLTMASSADITHNAEGHRKEFR